MLREHRAQATLIATVLLTVAVVAISVALYIAYVKTKSKLVTQPLQTSQLYEIINNIKVKNVTIQNGKTIITLSQNLPTKALVICYSEKTKKPREYVVGPGKKIIEIPCISNRQYVIIIPTREFTKIIKVIPAVQAISQKIINLTTITTSIINESMIIGSYKIYIINESKICHCPRHNTTCVTNVTCLAILYERYSKLHETVIVKRTKRNSAIVYNKLMVLLNKTLQPNNFVYLNTSIVMQGYKNVRCVEIAGKRSINTILSGPLITQSIYNCTIEGKKYYTNITVTLYINGKRMEINKTVIQLIPLNETSAWPPKGGCEVRLNLSKNSAKRPLDIKSLNISASSLIVGIINNINNEYAILTIRLSKGDHCHDCRKAKSLYISYTIFISLTACRSKEYKECKRFAKNIVDIEISATPVCCHGSCCKCEHRIDVKIVRRRIDPVAIFNIGDYSYVKNITIYYRLNVTEKKCGHCRCCHCCCKGISVSVVDYLFNVIVVPLPFSLSSK